MLVCLCCRSDHSFISTTFRDARAAFHAYRLKSMRATDRILCCSARLFEYATAPQVAMHLMLIATATAVQTEKPAMPSLGGVMLSPRRLSRKFKDRAKSIKFAGVCVIRQRRAESACFIFVQNSEKASLKIANPELYNERRGALGSGFAKRSAIC